MTGHASNCDYQSEILLATNIDGLRLIVNSLKNKNRLNKYCYVHIAEAYFGFYLKEKDSRLLEESHSYLLFASKHLNPRDNPEYRKCYELLIKIELEKPEPNYATIAKYDAFIPEMKMMKQLQIAEKAAERYIEQLKYYLNNPFEHAYPENLQEIIQAGNYEKLVRKVQQVNDFIQEYNNAFTGFKKNQSLQNLERILEPLNHLEQFNIRTAREKLRQFEKIKSYYHTISRVEKTNDDPAKVCQLAIHVFSIFNELNSVFPFLKAPPQDFFCVKKLACMSEQKQSEIKDLISNLSHTHDLSENQNKCRQMLSEFESAKSECSDPHITQFLRHQHFIMLKITELISAIEHLKNDNVIEPLKNVYESVNNIPNKPNTRELMHIAGYHMGLFYREQATNLLLRGTKHQPVGITLNQIGIILNELKPFRHYLDNTQIDIFMEYQHVRHFFDMININPQQATLIIQMINRNIVENWDLERILHNKLEEYSTKAEPEQINTSHTQHLNTDNQVILGNQPHERHQIQPISNSDENQKPDTINNQLESENDQSNQRVQQDIVGVSDNPQIASFETFARALLKFDEPLTCEFIRKFFADVESTSTKDCLSEILQILKKNIHSDDDRFRFFFAFALIRKAQADIHNYVENLAIAYNFANDNNQQSLVISELLKAKRIATDRNIRLSNSVMYKLRDNGLIDIWEEKQQRKRSNLEIYNVEQARLLSKSLNCDGSFFKDDQQEKIFEFLDRLCQAFKQEKNATKKRQYCHIYSSFMKNARCLKDNDILRWDQRFFEKH